MLYCHEKVCRKSSADQNAGHQDEAGSANLGERFDMVGPGEMDRTFSGVRGGVVQSVASAGVGQRYQ